MENDYIIRVLKSSVCPYLIIVMGFCLTSVWSEEKKEELVISDFEGDVESWKGGEVSTEKVKQGKYSFKWENLPSNPTLKCDSVPDDWSKYGVLSFWLYSEVANNQGLQLIISSENPESEGIDYYSATIRVSWTGWKQFRFSFTSLGAARSPRGWNQIDNMFFSSNGWGHKPLEDTLFYLDDVKLEKGAVSISTSSRATLAGPSVLANSSFEDKDGDGVPDGWELRPPPNNQTTFIQLVTLENSKVIRIEDKDSKQGVGISQMVKVSPGSTYKQTACLKGGNVALYFNWYDKDKKFISPEHAQIVAGGKDRFIKREYVQKAPDNAEWCLVWIYSTSTNITEVFVNRMEFMDMGKDFRQEVAISDVQFFSLLNLDFPGMEEVKSACQNKDFERAKAAYLDFRRNKSKIRWHISPKDKPEKPAGSTYPQADNIMKHIIPASMNAPEAFIGEDINWEFNPVSPSEPHFTKEWTWCNLNRMGFWNTLGQAYWLTLDEKYAQEWVSQVIDWVEDNPVPVDVGRGSTLTWRTIESGIRTSGSWMSAYNYFLFSSSFTPDAHCTFVKGVIEHGWRLNWAAKHYEETDEMGANWATMEMNGLGTIAILFPEIKEADEWRKNAIATMTRELDRQVYPDGAQIELTTGYHQVSRMNFMALAKVAQMNSVTLPADYVDKLKKMYVFNLYMMDPSGIAPPLNDAGPTDVKSSLMEAYQTWGDEEFLFGSTRGKQGKKPKYDSYFFNYAGYYTMRSGWEYLDKFLLFDAGPLGFGHYHEDMLNMYLYAFGRILLTEPGTYSYDQSKWRRYVLSTASHNTILVDGKEQRRSDDYNSRLIGEPLNNPWTTNPFFDYGAGTYSSGYQENRYQASQYSPMGYFGEKDRSVSHTRSVIFLKPHYFLAVDFLEGTGEHKYDAHFHLDAPDAEVDEKTKAVHTLRTDNVQLGLFPMDIKNLEVEIVKGREDPVLGWLPGQKRPIPTVVYSKKEQAPSLFSTLLYPYYRNKPEVKYREIMKNKSDIWAKAISTPYEEFAVIIRKTEGRSNVKIESEISAPFNANARVTVVRIPKETKETCLGFYDISEYSDDKFSFKIPSQVSVLVMKKDNKLFLFNSMEKEINFSFSVPSTTADVPFNKTFSVPAQVWVEISSGEMKKVGQDVSPFGKKETQLVDSSLPSYENYLARFKEKAKTISREVIVLEAEDMIEGDTRFKTSTTKIGAKNVIYMWDNVGQKIEKTFSVPENGFYRFLLKHCTGGEPARSLYIDGEVPFREVSYIQFASTKGDASSDGWSNKTSDWQFKEIADIRHSAESRPSGRGSGDGFLFYLTKGSHKLAVVNEGGGGLNLDYLVLIPEGIKKEEVIKKMEEVK